jgi:4-amino-4-deoxy-L-arabinose transferase-like glycosyltransferase
MSSGRAHSDAFAFTFRRLGRVIRRQTTIDVIALGALSLAARLPWVVLVHSGPSSDSFFYYLGAKSIAAGQGYQILGHPTAFFPVGWPAFLAGIFVVTGPSFLAVKVANLILWVVTTVLVYILGKKLGGRRVGLVAGALVAVAPTMVVYVTRGASENLFIPLFLGVCLLLLVAEGKAPSIPQAAAAGALLGLAILVRSTALLLPLVLPLWLLLRRRGRSWRAATAMAAVSVIVLVPWLVRNELVMHTFSLSTNGGYTIWVGANPQATGGFGVGDHRWPISSVASETRQNSWLLRESVSWVEGHPLSWLRLMPRKFEYLMSWRAGPITDLLGQQTGSNPRRGWQLRHLSRAETVLIRGSLDHLWLYELWHYWYWILGGIALVLATLKRLPGARLATLLVGFWIAFHVVLIHGEPRYMLSVTPLVAPALAWLLVATARQAASLPRRFWSTRIAPVRELDGRTDSRELERRVA